MQEATRMISRSSKSETCNLLVNHIWNHNLYAHYYWSRWLLKTQLSIMFSCGMLSVNGSSALCMGPTTSLTNKFCTEMCLSVGPVHCSRDPQTFFFTQTFIKNEFYCTIHIFKNYFAIVLSVFNKISVIQTDPKLLKWHLNSLSRQFVSLFVVKLVIVLAFSLANLGLFSIINGSSSYFFM